MNARIRITAALIALSLAAASVAFAQQGDKLGKVQFQNSCSPAVQEKFLARRGDAAFVLLFRGAEGLRGSGRRGQFLRDRRLGLRVHSHVEPAPGHWRLASRARSWRRPRSTRAATWARRPSESGSTSRRSPPTTRISPTVPNARASSPAPRPTEALAAKYPDDDEAQIFYALYLAGTQTASDQTYSAYLKAAGILEKQFAKHPDHPGSRTT